MRVDVDTPDEYQGDIVGDLNRRREQIHGIERSVAWAFCRQYSAVLAGASLCFPPFFLSRRKKKSVIPILCHKSGCFPGIDRSNRRRSHSVFRAAADKLHEKRRLSQKLYRRRSMRGRTCL